LGSFFLEKLKSAGEEEKERERETMSDDKKKLCASFSRILKLDDVDDEKALSEYLVQYFEGKVEIEEVESHKNANERRDRLVEYASRYSGLSEREVKMTVGRAFGKWKKGQKKAKKKNGMKQLGDVAIIAIGGYPGSGKSTLARAICHAFEASDLKAYWVNQDECGGSAKSYHRKIQDMCKAGTRILVLDKIHTIKVHFEKSIHAVRDSGADVSEFVFLRLFHKEGLDKTFETCLQRLENRGTAHRTLKVSNASEIEEVREILTRLIGGRQPYRYIEGEINKILKFPMQKFDIDICLKPAEMLHDALNILRTKFKPCDDLDKLNESSLMNALESSFEFERKLTSSSSSTSLSQKSTKKSSPSRGVGNKMKLSARYVALFLSEDSRSELLKRFPARYSTVLTDHITLYFNPPPECLASLTLGSIWTVHFCGRGAQHNEGVQAILVKSIQNGTTVMKHQLSGESMLHVTMSTAIGCNASESSSMLNHVYDEKRRTEYDDDKSFEIEARLGCEMKLGSRYFWRCFSSTEMGKLLGLKSLSHLKSCSSKGDLRTGTRRKGDGKLETEPSKNLIHNFISTRQFSESAQKDDVMHLRPVSDFERHLLHGFAESLNLCHESQGENEKRHVIIRLGLKE